MAAKVYVLEAESPNCGGRILRVYSNAMSANMEAASLCNIIRDDAVPVYGENEPRLLTPANWDTWDTVLELLQECYGARDCYVEVTRLEVRP